MDVGSAERPALSDILDLHDVYISAHAIGRLSRRGGLTPHHAREQILHRLASSHELSPSDPFFATNPQDIQGRLYFQDESDPNLIYVLKSRSSGSARNYRLSTTVMREDITALVSK